MQLLGNELREHFNVIYSPTLPMLNTGSVHSSAQMIHKKMQDILKYVKEEDINVVGHSLGGLIAIESVRIATDMRVNNVLTMASPLR